MKAMAFFTKFNMFNNNDTIQYTRGGNYNYFPSFGKVAKKKKKEKKRKDLKIPCGFTILLPPDFVD